MSSNRATPKRDQALQLLINCLAAGPRPANEIRHAAVAAGISPQMLQDVSKEIVDKKQTSDGWVWSLLAPRPLQSASICMRRGIWPYKSILMSALEDREFFSLLELIDDPVAQEVCRRLDLKLGESESQADEDESERRGYLAALQDLRATLRELEGGMPAGDQMFEMFSSIHKELDQLEQGQIVPNAPRSRTF